MTTNKQVIVIDVTREDGVRFVGRTHSGNGELIRSACGLPVVALTAGDATWASVPVGDFRKVTSALSAIHDFKMPRATAAMQVAK